MHSLPQGSRAFIADKGAVIVVIEVNGARNLRKFPKHFSVGVDDIDAAPIPRHDLRLAFAPAVFRDHDRFARKGLANAIEMSFNITGTTGCPAAVVLIG